MAAHWRIAVGDRSSSTRTGTPWVGHGGNQDEDVCYAGLRMRGCGRFDRSLIVALGCRPKEGRFENGGPLVFSILIPHPAVSPV